MTLLLSDALEAGYARLAIPFVTIAGMGDHRGLYKWCSRVPSYAAGDPHWRPLLKRGTEPYEVGEQSPGPIGGVAGAGELSIELVDGTGASGQPAADEVTRLLGDDATEELRLTTLVLASATAMTFAGTAADLARIVPFATVLHVGDEAVLVGANTSGATYNVTRGALDTDATQHAADAPVFFTSPLVFGRRMRLYLTVDAPGADAATETEQGSGWYLDDEELGDYLLSYQFRGRSLIKSLEAPVRSLLGYTGKIVRVDARSIDINIGAETSNGRGFGGVVWFRNGRELLGLDTDTAAGSATMAHAITWVLDDAYRGRGGTVREELREGTLLRQVCLADREGGLGSWRSQDKGAETTSRATGTWVAYDHPIACALGTMTSSASASDGLECTNFVAGKGNFSSLPVGFGMGVKATDIDWDSWLGIWERNPDWRLPYLVLDKNEKGREWLDREILKPFGIVAYSRGGKIFARTYRVPTASATAPTWTAANVRVEQSARGRYTPKIRARRARELAATSIVFELQGPTGEVVPLTFNDATFPELFGSRSGPGPSLGVIRIPVPGAQPDVTGASAMLRTRALRLLYRVRRVPLELEIETDLAEINHDAGDSILLTYPDLPLRRLRARGFANELLELSDRRVNVRTSTIQWKALALGTAGRFGLIAPSAVINGAPVGNVATCHANRYTSASAGSSLPVTDVAAFTIGDRVRLFTRQGTVVASVPAYQTVQSIGVNTLTLDGNFGGAWASGQVIGYVAYDDAVANQTDRYVFFADANGKLGAGDAAGFTFGES